MSTLPFPEKQFRLRTAREISAARGTVADCARKWGATDEAARHWLRLNAPGLVFTKQHTRPGRQGHSPEFVLKRLREIDACFAQGHGKAAASRILKYSAKNGVRNFLFRFARNGIAAAIADLEAQLNNPTIEPSTATAPGNGRANKGVLPSGSKVGPAQAGGATPPSTSSPDQFQHRKSA